MNLFFKLFLILILTFIALPSSASEVKLETSAEVSIGEKFIVDLVIDTPNNINAIEGRVLYPNSLLILKEIRDGASVLNFWVERPIISEDGEIFFSGITPLGFSGSGKLILSIVFEAKNQGMAQVSLEDFKVLLNDGAGTRDEVSVLANEIVINEGPVGISETDVIDLEIPEDFLPILAVDSELFDGKYFIVFSTQDKISGINYYEIREGYNGKFEKIQSPYVLKDQSLHKKIFIKAYDKAGNYRLVVFKPVEDDYQYIKVIIFVIIIIIIFFFRKKIWRRASKK